MGMFNSIKILCPLPDTEEKWIQESAKTSFRFQTKSIEPKNMDLYTITEDGRLIHHQVQWVEVPENERPYYGTPEWESDPGIYRFMGCMKSIPIGDFQIMKTIEVEFHDYQNDAYISYTAQFKDGILLGIKRNK